MEKTPEQKFCTECSGLKSVKIGGKNIPPKEWIKLGYACDIGCICN